jgi:uncharacterized protein YjbJ (UPF0337 family)
LRSTHDATEYPVGKQEMGMDNDRIKGAVKQKVGQIKEAAGKVTGDEKLKRQGQAEEVAGKVQNVVGGIKDSVRESQNVKR